MLLLYCCMVVSGLFSLVFGGEADSYAYEKLTRKWPKSVFFFGTKNMSEGRLMHTVLVCYVFDKLGQACLCG